MFAARSVRTISIAGVVLSVALWAFVARPAMADHDPHAAPGWWGATDGWTNCHEWGFESSNSVGNPNNPNWSPPADNPGWEHPGPEPAWGTNNPGGVGWEQVSGNGCLKITSGTTVTIHFYNGEDVNRTKEIWLQYEYMMTGSNTAPEFLFPAGTSAKKTKSPLDKWLGGYWYMRTVGYTLDPQPDWEEVKFTVHSGALWIRKLKFGSHCTEKLHCDGSDEQYWFPFPDWPPVADTSDLPDGYEQTEWNRAGSYPPDWSPELTDHEGVIGLPGGLPEPMLGLLSARFDANEQAQAPRRVGYQFDFYDAEGGEIHWEEVLPPGTTVENRQESHQELYAGWKRVAITFDALPAPDWVEFYWHMSAGGPLGGPVAIDNLIMSSASDRPRVPGQGYAGGRIQAVSLMPVVPLQGWAEDFDAYAPGSGMHGQGGWKGWDNDPAFDAFVTDIQSRSAPHSLDVAEDSDLVHEFDDYASDRWLFTAWQYVPSDFRSDDGTPFPPGTYFLLLNTYNDGGPYHWSVQMVFDSNDGMLKVSYGNGQDTIDVPYVTDEWVKLEAEIDLDDDWVQVRYGNIEFEPYSWTGGIYGDGGGALEVGAVDLFANGSSSVYYDDLSLRAALGP